MSARARQCHLLVTDVHEVGPQLRRLTLTGEALADLPHLGVPDEWMGLMVPGQFQSRYYTVRERTTSALIMDVAVHESGLVSDWIQGDPVGDQVTVSEPQAAYAPPADAGWVLAAGDLTGLPALARIAETETRPVTLLAQASEPLVDYLPESAQWVAPEADLARVVMDWELPAGPGYVWFAAESAAMRAVRSHLLRVLGWPTQRFHTMGYWRRSAGRQLRAVDPRPGVA